MAVRVLRLLEYVFDTPERAANDMCNWSHNMKSEGKWMRSATLPFEAVEWMEAP